MDLYIYYRVMCDREQELRSRVAAMQAMLKERHRIATALKRRPDAQDGRHTWMEIYSDIPDGFEAALAVAVSDATLATLIDGDRHTEHFLEIPPCA